MEIKLRLRARSDDLAGLAVADLGRLGEDLVLPVAGERARVNFELVFDDQELGTELAAPDKELRQVYVLVSPGLVRSRGDDVRPSELSRRILEASWNRGAIVGLVGIVRDEARRFGLDATIGCDQIDASRLSAVVHEVAQRLWFKLPPRPGAQRASVRVRPVTSADELRLCFKLRHLVYRSLGYLDGRVAGTESRLEFDGFDPNAAHYVVAPVTDSTRVVGTMRLIIPGLRARAGPSMCEADPRCADWCRRFANEESDRVFRDLLNHPFANSMPILESFDYFAALRGRALPDLADPGRSCELSRHRYRRATPPTPPPHHRSDATDDWTKPLRRA